MSIRMILDNIRMLMSDSDGVEFTDDQLVEFIVSAAQEVKAYIGTQTYRILKWNFNAVETTTLEVVSTNLTETIVTFTSQIDLETNRLKYEVATLISATDSSLIKQYPVIANTDTTITITGAMATDGFNIGDKIKVVYGKINENNFENYRNIKNQNGRLRQIDVAINGYLETIAQGYSEPNHYEDILQPISIIKINTKGNNVILDVSVNKPCELNEGIFESYDYTQEDLLVNPGMWLVSEGIIPEILDGQYVIVDNQNGDTFSLQVELQDGAYVDSISAQVYYLDNKAIISNAQKVTDVAMALIYDSLASKCALTGNDTGADFWQRKANEKRRKALGYFDGTFSSKSSIGITSPVDSTRAEEVFGDNNNKESVVSIDTETNRIKRVILAKQPWYLNQLGDVDDY